MKTQHITALALAASFVATATFAQDSPATPAPPPATAITAPALTPDQIVYAPQLPSVAELTRVATAQGLTIKQVTQSARAITVTYQSGDGPPNTVAYQLLSDAGVDPDRVASPPPVYVMPAYRSYYYDPYYPTYWYPPISLRFGYGFGFGHGRGHRR